MLDNGTKALSFSTSMIVIWLLAKELERAEDPHRDARLLLELAEDLRVNFAGKDKVPPPNALKETLTGLVCGACDLAGVQLPD